MTAGAVDLHAHVIVPEITREAGDGEPWRPRVFRDDTGAQVVETGGREIRAAISDYAEAHPDAFPAAHAPPDDGPPL